MQKKLIAAAVAALMSTGAMAQITMYGRLDVGYRSVESDTVRASDDSTVTTKATDTAWNTGSLTTSRLGWNITEDLGGGLNAFGNLELGINNLASQGADSSAAGVPFNTRTAFVGLKNDSMGALSLGRQTVLVDSVMLVGSVGGLNNHIGAAYTSGGLDLAIAGTLASNPTANGAASFTGGKLNNTRSANLIQYASPKFAGFNFAVQYGNSKTDAKAEPGVATEVAAENEMDELGFMAQFATGPLTVAVGYSAEERTAPTLTGTVVTGKAIVSEAKQMALAGTYDFGVAKVHAMYTDGDDKKADLDTRTGTNDTLFLTGRSNIEAGVKVPLGAVTVLASYFTGESDYSGSQGGADASFSLDHSGYQLGAMYSFSKRTTAYALYGSAEIEDSADSASTLEQDGFAFGIRHDF
jgi:predicted porin